MKNAFILYSLSILIVISSCGTPAKYPIDFPSSKNVDDRIIGTWKLEEDTNKSNFYEVSKRDVDFQYHVRFFDRGGTNPTYEHNIFFSDIGGTKFLNVPYWEKTADPAQFAGLRDLGYFYIKIAEANKDFTKLVTYTVSSKELSRLNSWQDVRQYMEEHRDDESIYTHKAHLYKIK